jgi:predicted nucleic acid-binding protein
LDAGEIAALALAMENRAIVLLDELRGRRVAAELGIPLLGVCGLLLQAKRQELVPQVMPLLRSIKASGYFISDILLTQIRELADE